MKITTFTPTDPFWVERAGEKGPVRVGMAIGWGLTNAGFAVPVFANAAVELHHGDRAAVTDDLKLLVGLVEKEGEPLMRDADIPTHPTPGRPPKETKTEERGPFGIKFSDKTYKLTSSWHYSSSGKQFIFHVPAEEPCPDDPTVEKVNKGQFASLKKEGVPVYSYEKVTGEASEEPPEEDDDDGVNELV